MIFIIQIPLPLLTRRRELEVRGNIALAGAVSMLVTDLHVSRQCKQTQRQEKNRDAPLEPFEQLARPVGIVTFEPSPFDRQPVKADAAVKLNREQQHKIERPPAAGPHSIRRFIWANVARMH